MSACTSKCTSEVQKLKSVEPTPCPVGASSETDLHRTTEQTLCRDGAGSKSTVVEERESEERNSVQQQIELSKCHWSEVSTVKLSSEAADGLEPGEADVDDEEEMAIVKVDNEQVFRALQQHPTWGTFFRTFNDPGGINYGGSMEVGEKFAEGGQAELFHAHIIWPNPKKNELCREWGDEWIVKLFKKGTLLRQLQQQWPHGYFQARVEEWVQHQFGKPLGIRHWCEVNCGTLLEDGRFAFVMVRETEDLRAFINRRVDLRIAQGRADCRPFSMTYAETVMYRVALGMDWLHNHNIVHRDLKASNVLVGKFHNRGCGFLVADFECSVGVVGTGFWRAPEILQALKDRNVSQRSEVFSKEADVYAYGMTCYEILTGKLPFENHSWRDYDLVLNGARPVVPEYVDDWAHELLRRCWQSNPADRPSFREILDLLLAESEQVRFHDEFIRERMKELEAGALQKSS